MKITATVNQKPDRARMRRYRLARLRAQLLRQDYAACVLFDPINIRYATDSRNMAVWCLHNPARYCFVPVEGPVIVFEFHGCVHLSADIETIDEVRPATSWFFFGSGPRIAEHARRWAAEIADLVRTYGRGERRLALDRCDAMGIAALRANGLVPGEGQGVLEYARRIKSADEMACITASIGVAQQGMERMRSALQPGMSEQQVWALLHQANIEGGGEWLETRLLSSGERTNPWMQECSARIIQPGDLVNFDTDLIGPYGYCADISRCYFAGSGSPSPAQRKLYRQAWEQIERNLSLLKPGMSFREIAERAWPIPPAYRDNRYSCLLHGVGLCDEYPRVPHLQDFERSGYEGELEEGMTACVESYIGEAGGAEGVKLEQQVAITASGAEILSDFPFEAELLPREV
jgi:Xaa-Pro aminopeptidase